MKMPIFVRRCYCCSSPVEEEDSPVEVNDEEPEKLEAVAAPYLKENQARLRRDYISIW